MNRLFAATAVARPDDRPRNGVLISNGRGRGSSAYALWNLEERGPLFIDPGDKVYQGMIIGEHSRDNDLEVNPLKGKQLTNIRTTARTRRSASPRRARCRWSRPSPISSDDELVEVTPKSIRLRKLYGALRMGLPSGPMTFGLVMELVVTPLLCLWQARVAERGSSGAGSM
jgi:GTP-binding protein